MTEESQGRVTACGCCGATGVPMRSVPYQRPGPGGYVWDAFTSCLTCNPTDGGVGDLREHGDRATALEDARGW